MLSFVSSKFAHVTLFLIWTRNFFVCFAYAPRLNTNKRKHRATTHNAYHNIGLKRSTASLDSSVQQFSVCEHGLRLREYIMCMR